MNGDEQEVKKVKEEVETMNEEGVEELVEYC